jgi:adenine-specific DNA methylase
VSRGGYYNCPECGQKEKIIDGVSEQGKPDERLYAVEYYCEECDEAGEPKSVHKGYKRAEIADKRLYQEAVEEWDERTDLHEYVPSEEIPLGILTDSSKFEGSIGGGFGLLRQGYSDWTDMFNTRQLLSLSKIIMSIEKTDSSDIRELLLLAFSESLNYNSMMIVYNPSYNKGTNIFKVNSFDPPQKPIENNPWGTEYGTGTFTKMYEMIKRGVSYAGAPTERFIGNGETIQTDKFSAAVGNNSSIKCEDMRSVSDPEDSSQEYDLILTDPPYYDNVIYSELSDYYFVWLKILLSDEYNAFSGNKTPRDDSIVANPAVQKGVDEFEHELDQAFTKIRDLITEDGILAFTYHHSDEESWGELLQSLCETGFEVTATYPINSELNKFVSGETVSFDIVIVARLINSRSPISWNTLRRRIIKTAKQTHETLEEERELSSGDIGVIEMGKCFQEYSKHHDEIRGAREGMTAKDVVDEIYGIIQDGDRGEQDVYLDLLEETDPSYSDLNKHLKRSDASNETMKQMRLFRMEGNEFVLIDWNDEKRQAYLQDKVEEDSESVSNLDRAHFLRYQYEHDKSRSRYLSQWDINDLQEICEDLAIVTGDETYLKMLGVNTTLAEISGQ